MKFSPNFSLVENLFFHYSQSIYVTFAKAKSPILSLENLRGIVRRAKPRKTENSIVTEKSKSRDRADSSSMIFQP